MRSVGSPERHNRRRGSCPQLILPLQLALLASLAFNASWIISDLMIRPASPRVRIAEAHPPDSPEPPLVPPAKKLEVGGKPCGSPEDEELVAHLRNIVLIVNNKNDPTGVNTGGFMRQVYSRYFDNIVVIGPEGIPEHGIEARGQDEKTKEWFYAYFHFPSIVARYPKADGYLWLDSDSVLNYWALKSANKSKLWVPNFPDCGLCQTFIPFNENLNEGYYTWDGWSGYPQVKRSAMLAISHCELRHIHGYNRNILPRKEGFHKRIVDIFYVPRRHADAISFDMIPVLRDHGVRSQVAIPMMFFALEPFRETDPILWSMEYKFKKGEDDHGVLRYWSKKSAAYHPWSLSRELREHSLRLLGQGDQCLLEFIPLLKNQSMFPV